MKECRICKAKSPDDVMFCIICGTKFPEQIPEQIKSYDNENALSEEKSPRPEQSSFVPLEKKYEYLAVNKGRVYLKIMSEHKSELQNEKDSDALSDLYAKYTTEYLNKLGDERWELIDSDLRFAGHLNGFLFKREKI